MRTTLETMLRFFFRAFLYFSLHAMIAHAAYRRTELNETALIGAFSKTFSLRDDSIIETVNVRGMHWILDIIQRQDLPYNITHMRELDDIDLLSISMKAAVAGISPWLRDNISDKIILHETHGTPFLETTISELEVPIYIGIICVMACTIILQHMHINGGALSPAQVSDTDKK